jgi:peroxiredoxin
MANDLTGDFDIVAEFAIHAVNRLLAAMHRIERFPHSASMHVDDTPAPGLHPKPSAVEVVDALGDAIVDSGFIRPPNLSVGAWSDVATYSRLGGIVNIDAVTAELPPLIPSHLKGRAQLQLSPPTIEVADSSGSKVKVRLQIMARYLPDPGTSPLAEFILGNLEMTAPVNHVASQVANVLAIDIKANSVQVAFTPVWSSVPLSAQDRASIELLIRNALKTSFVPSNITLPSSIHSLQVKALTGGQHAVAILLNTGGAPGNPASANNVFLAGSDDFAFAAGVDFIRSAFQPTLDEILSRPVDPVKFNISGVVYTWHITYTITLKSAAVALENGRIVLTIKGHAHTDSWPPNFDFTVRQLFTLQPDGATADLVVGDISLDTSSWIVDRFRGGALSALRTLRDRALAESGAAATVRRMLSAEENLGGVLRALLTPARKSVRTPLFPAYSLAYTRVAISPSGIVLHGSLGVRAWPPAHVEFEQIAWEGKGPHGIVSSGPAYSALKTWVPGGTIQSYEWKPFGQTQPGALDNHKFVRLPPPAVVGVADAALSVIHGYAPLCLTVRGSRLSASGPVVAEPVTGTVCAFDSFPVVTGGVESADGGEPLVALTRPRPDGLVDIIGHASARETTPGFPRPNLLIHFADANSARHLDRLSDGLRDSGRTDAATSIVAILPKGDLTKVPYTPGIVYGDDEKPWERTLGTRIAARPATLIVDPKGNVVWHHEGETEGSQLVTALRKVLVGGIPPTTRTLKSNVRIGHPPPDFVFEFTGGQQLTLGKLAGTPVTLVFWRSTSQPSIDAVLRARPADGRGGAPHEAILLAVNDGEAVDVARRAAAAHRLPGTLVTDPNRAISVAYGVSAWPLSISIDASGLITELRYGTLDGSEELPVQPGSRAAH